MLRPHIVILGAGFGGVYVAKKLRNRVKKGEIDVTIVNRSNNFLFTPLLHEVATGGLQPRTVAEPLREIFVNTQIRIVQGEVESINSGRQTVNVCGNSHSITIPYDYLLIATGAETNYYNIPGAPEWTLPLKTLADAALIRNRIIDAFEQAVLTDNPEVRRRLLSFVIVGGGATGVEVAAELSEFVEGMVKRYYGRTHCRIDDARRCESEEPSLTLIHAGKELLEMFSPKLRVAAHAHLEKRGVRVLANTAVTSVSKNGLMLGEETIPASVIIWSAGVKPAVPRFEDINPEILAGRLSVDRNFRLTGSDKIFVIGDVAGYVEKEQSASADPNAKPKPVPQLAQAAVSESKTVARNIIASIYKRNLKEFRFNSKGSMVSVGQWFAIGEIYSMHIAGKFTWWLWRTVYLFKFASWKKRIRIGIEWFLQLFFPRDITKIS